MVAQYCLPYLQEEIHSEAKKNSFLLPADSFNDALHTKGPKMKCAVSALAAEGFITLDNVCVSTT